MEERCYMDDIIKLEDLEPKKGDKDA